MVNKDSLSYKRGFAKGVEFYTETLKKLRIYTLKTCQPYEKSVKRPQKKANGDYYPFYLASATVIIIY